MYPYSLGGTYYSIQQGENYWPFPQRITPYDGVFNPGLNPNPLSNFTTRAAHCMSKAAVDLKSSMRLLWEQHIAWTRMVILSIIFNLPDLDFVTARLLQNPTDMGNLLKPLYGDNIATRFSSLIKDHLVIAADLVKAAKAGDQNAAGSREKMVFQWRRNF
jgi:hypothetical protein